MNPLRRALGAQTGEQQVPRCSQLPVWLPKVVEGWRAAREILHVLPQN